MQQIVHKRWFTGAKYFLTFLLSTVPRILTTTTDVCALLATTREVRASASLLDQDQTLTERTSPSAEGSHPLHPQTAAEDSQRKDHQDSRGRGPGLGPGPDPSPVQESLHRGPVLGPVQGSAQGHGPARQRGLGPRGPAHDQGLPKGPGGQGQGRPCPRDLDRPRDPDQDPQPGHGRVLRLRRVNQDRLHRDQIRASLGVITCPAPPFVINHHPNPSLSRSRKANIFHNCPFPHSILMSISYYYIYCVTSCIKADYIFARIHDERLRLTVENRIMRLYPRRVMHQNLKLF